MLNKKYNFRAVNQLWEDLFTLKLNDKPSKGEWLYHNNEYHLIIEIVHQENKDTILVIKNIKNEENIEESRGSTKNT